MALSANTDSASMPAERLRRLAAITVAMTVVVGESGPKALALTRRFGLRSRRDGLLSKSDPAASVAKPSAICVAAVPLACLIAIPMPHSALRPGL